MIPDSCLLYRDMQRGDQRLNERQPTILGLLYRDMQRGDQRLLNTTLKNADTALKYCSPLCRD